ncbi:proline--tRNA ligase [Candidatus Geothermarchaeota archaeon ex4572_27]|nr:MAG: proline--tRNA ligase [Candidatus Geothermarchaeota archaeon ex4572_27]
MPEAKRKREDFTRWFREVTLAAEVYDYRVLVKGCGVWPGYGFKLRSLVLSIIRQLLDETGHEECLFPLLIPQSLLAKEAEHIRSFEREVFWVTRGGATELDEKLALRPTSETVVMPMFKLWIHSHSDLPKKVYQVVSVFRYETKATHPMIRVREVTTFKEAHTAHATFEDAERQVWEAVGIYRRFFDELGIPYVISRRPEWDKFAGAVYTISFDTIMPEGRALQIGTVHHLGQNFSRPFEVEYLRPDGTRDYVYTTSYGISERVIAALIAIHGDDRGLVLPPKVAPIQAVVVPIPYKGVEAKVLEASRRVYEELQRGGLRVKLDGREDITPGEKYYYWELKGVPVRVEVGPRDVDEGLVTLSRRDTLERARCPVSEVVDRVRELFRDIEDSLRRRAWSEFKERLIYADSLEEARRLIAERAGIVHVAWCGSMECGLKLEEAIEGRVLGTPIEGERVEGRCVMCGGEADSYVRLAKTF